MPDPMTDTLWQTKLYARLHDPAEKALVLLRDLAGHEGGTIRKLQARLFGHSLPADIRRHVKWADWWASAADRPQWPVESGNGRVKDWARVDWAKQPVLIHPLSGDEIDLKGLAETDIEDIKARSLEHFEKLIIPNGENTDWHRTLLAFWRFGPELQEERDQGTLGALWPLLPADTRIPDHSIWEHLDLTSAFAGAFAADGKSAPALLALSLGPVQPFIAAARSTSDLWAGSHLLAHLAWEAMKVICEHLGPDAIVSPQLRGIPLVDSWLREECGLKKDWFARCEWVRQSSSDANPLFSAALPNRFLAIVPASWVEDLTTTIQEKVRNWLASCGKEVVHRLLEAAGLADQDDPHAYRQLSEQLRGFPEIHWAAVPFSLIHARNRDSQRDLDTTALSSAMAPFFNTEDGNASGFLGSKAWQVLQRDIRWKDNTAFWSPNPGVLYPAIHDLTERLLAAAKTTRPFGQTEQQGWRCSLTGETEWLTSDANHLSVPYRSRKDTLWAKVSEKKPSWAKSGEHLGTLPAIKRLWPTVFAEQVAQVLGTEQTISRFVVSTHTMALAHQLHEWLKTEPEPNTELRERLDACDPVALPRKLLSNRDPEGALYWAKRIPALLEAVRDTDRDAERQHVERQITRELAGDGKSAPRLETCYALIMLDGDHMGGILSGDKGAIKYLDSFHPRVRAGFKARSSGHREIAEYGEQKRAASPNRHLAVSAALNNFSLCVVPHIIELEHPGRVIYAGGDDVLAMLPVADLLRVMQKLRMAYSGEDHNTRAEEHADNALNELANLRKGGTQLQFARGFARLEGKLMRMMGGATASCGAVIAHYQTPLSVALRELRAAEQRAKNDGGRDAFSLTVLKRSGGSLRFTAKWGEPLRLMNRLTCFLADPAVSRRAAYHCQTWIRDLPDSQDGEMVEKLIHHQFIQQTSNSAALNRHDARELASGLVNLAVQNTEPRSWLMNMFGIAEFLARETRQ